MTLTPTQGFTVAVVVFAVFAAVAVLSWWADR